MNKLEHLYTEAFNNITQIVNFYFSTQEEPNNYIPKEVITDEKLIYDLIKTHFKQPTLEEVKKEWEEKGWKIDEDGYFKTITFIKGDRGIKFDIEGKYYFTFQPEADHNSFDIDIEFHTLIHKTLKALEVENEK